jgi:hypothetical protein
MSTNKKFKKGFEKSAPGSDDGLRGQPAEHGAGEAEARPDAQDDAGAAPHRASGDNPTTTTTEFTTTKAL